HYGLRGVFGEGLTPILQQLGTMRRRDVLAKAREYGMVSKSLSDADAWAAMSAKDRLSAAEEVLAELAQTQPTIGFVKRAIALIRNWLRKNVPGFNNLRLTDSDIVAGYILPARGFVTRSQETPKQSIERAMLAFSRVWHGSPHKFLQFDSSKIGTGEGAQAYGHGLYLAESPDVAKGYRSKLNDRPITSVKADRYDIAGDPNWIIKAFDDAGELIPKVNGYLAPEEIAKHYGNEVADMVLKSEYGGHFRNLNIQDGALYQVDLPDDQIAKMLDWDNPLSEQTEQVKQALMDAVESGKLKGGYITGAMGERKYQPALSWDKSGESLLRSLERVVGFGGNAEALLKDIGIPGIRYLDGASRGNGAGTSNYVIFPGMEKMLTILDVNGEPVTGAEKAKVLGDQMDMAFSRGTNEAMTNKDVVGNTQGGRSADDSTPGADKYQMAGPVVDGRDVRDDVPNMSSIASSLDDYTVLKGVREVPMSDFTFSGKSYSVSETKRIENLAERIKESGEINPLIVVVDKEGSYVLEGGHRGEALFRLGAKSFPAVVVLDNESLNESTAPDSGGAAFSRTAGDQTQTEAFKKWFGESAVVDAEGTPLVVYHGTIRSFDAFDQNAEPFTYESDRGKQFFLSNPLGASEYAIGTSDAYGGNANVMPVYLRMENPRIEEVDGPPSEWWDRNGDDLYWKLDVSGSDHDGLIVRGDGETMYVTANPNQIKSATGNSGTFNPTNPDIRFS
ncbi:MAG: ADP-ribosyltransferase-containing protein, partial [Rhodanobacter sp.]